MCKYHFKKRIFIQKSFGDLQIEGKVAVKTRETCWQEADQAAVALVSVHTAFHTGPEGELKMRAFLEALKGEIGSQLVVLISDGAHEEVMGFAMREQARRDAFVLIDRFEDVFEGCQVVLWNDYIRGAEGYLDAKGEVTKLYEEDREFRKLVIEDAQLSYTDERRDEFPDEQEYLQRAALDLLEQCAAYEVLVKQGVAYQFYPGHQHACIHYLNRNKRISLVHVFVSIEKKKWISPSIFMSEEKSEVAAGKSAE